MIILVLDGNENQAVAATRSLADAGHRVLVGAETAWSKAGWSRHAARTFVYPSPERDVEAFITRVVRVTRDCRGAFVMPMTERTLLPISRARSRLTEAGGLFVLPDHARVLEACSKTHTTRLAQSLGIAVPRTWMLEDAGEAVRIARELPYPVVLKPAMSHEPIRGALRSTGAPAYARNATEFIESWHELAARTRSIVVQEFVTGRGAGYFALVDRGEPLVEFAHRRIRDVRPTGSGSAVRESVPLDPQVRGASRQLLAALGWRGVAMVEFRVRPDGSPVFLEINGRFWNSLPLAVAAGVDFPRLLVELGTTGRVAEQPSYRTGVRCRWWLGDVRHLLHVWRGAPRGWPGNFPGRLSTLAAFLMPRPGTVHDNFRWSDPLPEIGDWLHFVGRRLPARLIRRRRRAPRTTHRTPATTHEAHSMLKGALHIHSTYSDGELTLRELRGMYLASGCRFACVTDHADYFDDASLRAYVAECAALSGDGFRFVPGLEFSCVRRMHIVGYGVTRLVEAMDPAAVIRHIESCGGVSVIAHPKDRHFDWIADLDPLPQGLEVWNSKYDGRYAPRAGTFTLLRRLQVRRPDLRAFYGQDLHWRTQYRGLMVYVEAEAATREALLSALRTGAFHCGKDGVSLRSDGALPEALMRHMERARRWSDRLRGLLRTMKRAADRLGLPVPAGIKAQARRVM